MRHRLVRALSAPSGQRRAPPGRAGPTTGRRLLAGVFASLLAIGVPISTVAGLGTSAAAGVTTRVAASLRAAPATDPFPTGKVTFAGHGWGPAIGMGQWGAFGYAAQHHRTYAWILSHFYGGTTLAHVGDPLVRVAIDENLGQRVAVTSPSSFRFGGTVIPAGHAARATLDPTTARWRIAEATSCSRPLRAWRIIARNLKDPVAVPASQAFGAPASKLLTICRGDGVKMTVRGTVEAYDHRGGMRTINRLRLEEYVADVTPSESSSGWAGYGGAGPQNQQWGFQSLEAQAIAARTYTKAYEAGGGWYGYADICDSDCQSYPGIANESPLATLATHDTAGMILDTPGGQPAPTEYSASTGGYTVDDSTWAGTSPFPAVPDAGDAVCLQTIGWTCNSLHTWTESVTVATIESTWPSVGNLESVKVVSRYGSAKSAYGGRVATIEIIGAHGTVNAAGYDFASDFGFWSDWFAVTDGPGASAPPPGGTRSLSGATGPRSSWPARPTSASGLFRATGPLPQRALHSLHRALRPLLQPAPTRRLSAGAVGHG